MSKTYVTLYDATGTTRTRSMTLACTPAAAQSMLSAAAKDNGVHSVIRRRRRSMRRERSNP